MGFPVACSLLLPGWLPEAQDFPRCWAITPRFSWWREPWPERFWVHYRAQLETYGVPRIAEILHKIGAEQERIVLLCHESDPSQCHRSLFAGWWMTQTGEVVEELT
jgi:hypothetical protein